MRIDFSKIKALAGLLLLFAGISFFDVMLQYGEGSNADAVFQSIGRYSLHALWVALKIGLLLCGALLLLTPRFAKRIVAPVWCAICFVEAVQIVARAKFGITLDGDWLMMMLASSAEEMAQFWSGICRSVVFWCAGALGILLAWGGAIGCRRSISATEGLAWWKRITLAVVYMAPFVICNVVFGFHIQMFNEVTFLFLPVDTIGHYARFSDMIRTAKSPRMPLEDFPEVSLEGSPIFVFVVGESATRNNWGLYGYGRSTTPRMDELVDELVVVSNVTATCAMTGQSMRMLLTMATVESPAATQCTLAQCYRAMGFRTALISNQARWGRWTGVEGLLFAGCDELCYLRSETTERPLFDTAILPRLAKFLQIPDPYVVFLHLQGSHEPFFTNYPLDWGRFGSRTMLDVYDNTILFSDHILGEIVSMLKRTNRPALLFYTSDHGESPREGRWRYGGSPDLLAVPCILWYSKGPSNLGFFRAADGLTLDRLFPLLLRLPGCFCGADGANSGGTL